MARTIEEGKYSYRAPGDLPLATGCLAMTPAGRTAFRARWSSGLKIDVLGFALFAPPAQ